MRIAIVSTPFIRVPPAGYGGTELFCHELAEELHARGHDVTLFTTGGSSASCRLRWLYPDPAWPPHPHDEILHAAWAMSAAAAAGAEVVHLNSALGMPEARLARRARRLHHPSSPRPGDVAPLPGAPGRRLRRHQPPPARAVERRCPERS